MSKQNISIGTAANDGTGDTLRVAGQKINNNFNEIYTHFGSSGTLSAFVNFTDSGYDLVDSSFTNRIKTVNLTNHRRTFFPDDSGNVVLDVATQTLTNKTLTTPVISSISNTGTLTLPTSTDTLVGRATTDTLTNKTVTSATLLGNTKLMSGFNFVDSSGDEVLSITLNTAGTAVSHLSLTNSNTLTKTGAGTSTSGAGITTVAGSASDLNLASAGGAVRIVGSIGHQTDEISATSHTYAAADDGVLILTASSTKTITLSDGVVSGTYKYIINNNTGSANITGRFPSQSTSGNSTLTLTPRQAAQCMWVDNSTDGTNYGWYLMGGVDSNALS